MIPIPRQSWRKFTFANRSISPFRHRPIDYEFVALLSLLSHCLRPYNDEHVMAVKHFRQ